jgi:AcrR family transcriptional regulator
MAKKTMLPAHQARSRETLARLLSAGARALERDGLDGATVPRIAALAGLTPGAIYRRFPNKDALLREICLRLLEDNARHTERLLAAERWQHASLAELTRHVIATTVRSHAQHRGLLRALTLFTLQHPNPDFVRRSEALQWRVIRTVTDLLVSRRDEMRHPDPEFAVPFALLLTGVTAKGLLILPRKPGHFSRFLPDVEARLEDELPEVVLRYLGIDED